MDQICIYHTNNAVILNVEFVGFGQTPLFMYNFFVCVLNFGV